MTNSSLRRKEESDKVDHESKLDMRKHQLTLQTEILDMSESNSNISISFYLITSKHLEMIPKVLGKLCSEFQSLQREPHKLDINPD